MQQQIEHIINSVTTCQENQLMLVKNWKLSGKLPGNWRKVGKYEGVV